MRKALAILAALFLTGCAVLRCDSTAEGIFPDDSAFESGIPVTEAWAQ